MGVDIVEWRRVMVGGMRTVVRVLRVDRAGRKSGCSIEWRKYVWLEDWSLEAWRGVEEEEGRVEDGCIIWR